MKAVSYTSSSSLPAVVTECAGKVIFVNTKERGQAEERLGPGPGGIPWCPGHEAFCSAACLAHHAGGKAFEVTDHQ